MSEPVVKLSHLADICLLCPVADEASYHVECYFCCHLKELGWYLYICYTNEVSLVLCNLRSGRSWNFGCLCGSNYKLFFTPKLVDILWDPRSLLVHGLQDSVPDS
jgi:hypothetical protein